MYEFYVIYYLSFFKVSPQTVLFARPNQRAGIFKQHRSGSQYEDAVRADVVHKDYHVKKQTQRRVNTIIRFVKNIW